MLIKTKPFGEIEVSEKQILDFPDGILGFDFVRKFVLLDTEDDNSPFKWLQAYEEPELAFVVIMPVDFMGEYELKVTSGDLEFVGSDNPDNLIIFVIVTIPENPSEMTANLQGPLIINIEKKIGKQAISLNENYSVRHRILEEMQKVSRGEG